ncbi:MAG TPA: PRC-barrel domain-containing protein [Devosia sp.]|nr:PRC-barrel domain-containing protein [Devosia sp.]
MSSEQAATPPVRTPVDILAGYSLVDSDMLVSRILNMPVYNGTGNDAQQVGTINDLILSGTGEVAAVVVGVGGFLGLGEKQVAVDYSALQFTVAEDNTERYVLDTTVEQLTSAPDFQVVDDNPAEGSSMVDSSMSSTQ